MNSLSPNSPSSTVETTASPPAVELDGVSISVAGQPLLSGIDAVLPAGKIVLITGESGAGKSVLLKVLAGLEDRSVVDVRGGIRIAGEERRRGNPKIGIVFQSFALFDELTPEDNVAFAADHSKSESRRTPREWLREFDVPPDPPVRYLSGGQQQRLAVARTLAYDPPILVYDEPTSGLDPGNAARVAAHIRSTGAAHGKTSIIVSHDYATLAPIADVVYLLDAASHRLVELTPLEIEHLDERFDARTRPDAPVRKKVSWPERALCSFLAFLEGSGRALEAAISSVFHVVPLFPSARWGARFLIHYLGLVASPSAWLYFLFAGAIAGFVSTYFTFEFLPHRRITEPLFADEVLQGLGTIVYRTVVPVLATILMAARSGAAVASDVGQRSHAHQMDSLRSFGVRPSAYLLTNILWAFILSTPLLVLASYLAAQLTSLVVFVYGFPERGAFFWESHFLHDLRRGASILYHGSLWLLAKVLLCGVGTGAIAFHIGARRKGSGVDVARGITSTIIFATIWVLIVHSAFAFFEFEEFR
jgi:ABC-type multidrug transport system ATPase subunit/ABC-type transporter Mla maintaining outer membrane lipid asymmetry permease subunit MlaE